MYPRVSTLSKTPRAEIKTYQGLPTLFINGRPNSGYGYSTYHRHASKWIAAFRNAGVNIVNISEAATKIIHPCFQDPVHYAPPQPLTWTSPSSFDYTIMDKHIRDVLKVHPHAYLILRVDMMAPDWWCEKHPSDTLKSDDPSHKNMWLHKQPYHSWASARWRRAGTHALRRFISHVHNSSYASRVIGYHICDGSTQEWFSYGSPWAEKDNCLWDYSEVCRQAFIRWLKKKYRTVAGLRSAWNNPSITFEKIAVPGRKERIHADFGVFRNPVKSRHVIDYYLFYNTLPDSLISHYARVVKQATDGRSLCGVFYGYTFGVLGSAETGHLGLARLLRCPDVDYLCSPTGQEGRPLGAGASIFNVPVDAVFFHGKQFWTESDPATCLQQRKDQPLCNVQEAISIQKRELTQTVCKGSLQYWFDLGGGWYDDPKLMKAVAKLRKIGETCFTLRGKSVAEVAVVLDENSMCCLNGNVRFGLPGLLLSRQNLYLAKSGVPFESVLLDDLPRVRPYRLYIFLNAFALTASKKAMIERVVKRLGRWALWVYAPGFIQEKFSNEAMASLTGINIGYEAVSQPLGVNITDFNDPITRNLPRNISWRDEWKAVDLHYIRKKGVTAPAWGDLSVNPVFYANDPTAKTLGVLNAGRLKGKPALVVKRYPEWTSVYCAAPDMPGWLIQAVAEAAGIHVYCREYHDSVLVNSRFIGIHTLRAGRKNFTFPKRVSFYDLFAGKWVANDVSSCSVTLPGKSTALYYYGSKTAKVARILEKSRC